MVSVGERRMPPAYLDEQLLKITVLGNSADRRAGGAAPNRPSTRAEFSL